MGTVNLKELYKDVGSKQVTERGNPLQYISKDQAAEYDLEIINVVTIVTRKKEPAFIVKFKVLSSTHPSIRVGDATRTWFQKIDSDTGLAAVKAFMLAVGDVDQTNEAELAEACAEMSEAIEAACGADQALTGKKVHVVCKHILTKDKQSDFTLHMFSPFRAAA